MSKKEFLSKITIHPTAWIGHGEFAIKLVESLQPQITVDLGVDYGFSSFCLAYPQVGTVYGIDWFMGDEHTGFRNTYESVISLHQELGLENLIFVKGDFSEICKVWNRQINILHIDGLHTYEAVSNDYKNWSKFCNDESVIMFHDVESFPGSVGKFFHEIEGFKIVKKDSAGLGIITKSEATFDRIKSLLDEL